MSWSPTIGFACHWDRNPPGTWSGTPWNLREAMRRVSCLEDLAVGPPVPVRALLKLAGMRRHAGAWSSMWRHSRVHTRWVELDLARQAKRVDPDAVVEIQDLGPVDRPYLVVQDLSYGLLLDRYGAREIPHFRTLGAPRVQQLHERQVRLYAGAAALLPMSGWLANHMAATGIPEERIRVVNPGVTLPGADLPLPERRTGKTRRLLMVGRDFHTKGGAQVVAAFARLRANLGDAIELTVIGPAAWPLRGDIPQGIHFLGPQPREVVAAALDTHDLFVMPSLLEGYGIAFAEALVRGLPCIGRNDCAMPEIIEPRSGGRLVETEDPDELAELIDKALRDDTLYAECAKAAPARLQHYSWDRAAGEVLAAVREVCS